MWLIFEDFESTQSLVFFLEKTREQQLTTEQTKQYALDASR